MHDIRNMREESDDAAWLDVTMVGGDYEVHMNQKTGQQRHRPRTFGGALNPHDWRSGAAPKAKSNG
jgi:hypothetical protein